MSAVVSSRPVLQPVKPNLINGNPNLTYEIVQPKVTKINWDDARIQRMLAIYDMFEHRSQNKTVTITTSDGRKSSDIFFYSSEIINEKIRYEGEASPFDKALAKCFRMAEHELFKHIPVDPGKIVRATREAGWMQHPPYLAICTDNNYTYIGSDELMGTPRHELPQKGIKAAMGILYPNGHMSIKDGNFWYYLGAMTKEFTLKDIDFTCFGNDMVKFEEFLQAVTATASKEIILLNSLKCRFTKLTPEVIKALADYSVTAAVRKKQLETELSSLKKKLVTEDVTVIADQLVKLKRILADMNPRKETFSTQRLKELESFQTQHDTLKRYMYVMKQLQGHTHFVADLGSREQYLQVAEELENSAYNEDRKFDDTVGYRTALLYYQEALKMGEDSETYRKVGRIKADLADIEAAMGSLLSSIRLDRKNVRAISNLAYLYLKIGQIDEAENICLIGLAIDPNNFYANLNYCEILAQRFAVSKSKDVSLYNKALEHSRKAALNAGEDQKEYLKEVMQTFAMPCA